MRFEWLAPMKAAISEVLETMFFVLVEFEEHPACVVNYDVQAGITLHRSDCRLEIAFRMTDAFARMVTANLLGTAEEDVASEDTEDSVKELANMVGGNFQTRIPDEDWQLGIPSVEKPAPPTSDGEEGLFFSCMGEAMGLVKVAFVPLNG